MKQSSWACTLLIQLSLCFAIYVSLHLGRPFVFLNQQATDGGHLDLYFISVAGGFRPLHRQARLLKVMETAAKSYNPQFVVNISELGEDDPLLQNATRLSSSLRLQWYTTGASGKSGFGYFTEHIKLPLGGSLDIVFLGNVSSQQDLVLTGALPGTEINHLNWLARALKAASGDWRIVVGSTPLCGYAHGKEPKGSKYVAGTLQQILTKYGVNVYLSNKECSSGASQDSLACIVVPNLKENQRYAGVSQDGSVIKREMDDGFLLHRVSSLEFVTYFINSSGQFIGTRTVKQLGKEVM